MEAKSGLNLNDIRETLAQPEEVRISSLLSEEQKLNIARARANKPRQKKLFDDIDAYCAEIMGRFGYEAYKAWKAGNIENEFMGKMLLAERARDKQKLLNLEAMVIASAGSVSMRRKPSAVKKASKTAIDIYRKEAKYARGEF